MRWKLIAAAAIVAAAPALADVKAGVDAWSRGDYARAVDEWGGPAVAGNPDAQFNLGQAYKLGRGVPADPTLAEDWFRKAAAQGHEQAEANYALALFQNGRKSEAAPWLEKSTARDEPRTELVYGTMLFNGDGVPRDYPRAYALMTRAAAARPGTDGLQSARETLSQMDSYISYAERERGTALAQQIALAASSRSDGGAANTRVTEQMPRPEAPVSKLAAAIPATPARGGWRVQLGAFRDRGNAEALWVRVQGKLNGASPTYMTSGGLTRLQAAGFANKSKAQAACARAGVGCVVVAP